MKDSKSRDSRRVQAVGSYGYQNFGDDLFVNTLMQRSAEIWPGAKMRTFAPLKSNVYAQPNALGKLLRAGTALAGLMWADTISLCGGSIMQDVKGIARWRQHALPFKRVEALGVSIGPFQNPEAESRVKDLADQVDRLVVRDPSSAERALTLGFTTDRTLLGGDLVALNRSIKKSDSKSGAISICPSAASRTEFSVLYHEVRKGLQQVSEFYDAKPDVNILALASTPTANDEPIGQLLSEKLTELGYSVKFVPYSAVGIRGMIEILTESSMVWSQRLHGAIVSYLADVPFLLDGHHAKCIDFAEDIRLNSKLLVNVADGWGAGIRALLDDETRSGMSPTGYKRRAEEAYTGATALE
ncbi:polysaccharide pyruvyl transferase family protein [Corynebacterium efficiens]|uniref:polysaccharide pyruvyl transferase family protein n=1 Tax=Corynebacterium efficiens TaxID=152794 RepID=UPI0009D6AFF9|nr:polysaccharide pyruvyl transferase family protein [Corynebacterium efficiens]